MSHIDKDKLHRMLKTREMFWITLEEIDYLLELVEKDLNNV